MNHIAQHQKTKRSMFQERGLFGVAVYEFKKVKNYLLLFPIKFVLLKESHKNAKFIGW